MPKADSSRVRAAGLHQPYCAKPEVYVAREEPCERLLDIDSFIPALGVRLQRLVGILPKAIARRCGTAAAPPARMGMVRRGGLRRAANVVVREARAAYARVESALQARRRLRAACEAGDDEAASHALTDIPPDSRWPEVAAASASTGARKHTSSGIGNVLRAQCVRPPTCARQRDSTTTRAFVKITKRPDFVDLATRVSFFMIDLIIKPAGNKNENGMRYKREKRRNFKQKQISKTWHQKYPSLIRRKCLI